MGSLAFCKHYEVSVVQVRKAAQLLKNLCIKLFDLLDDLFVVFLGQKFFSLEHIGSEAGYLLGILRVLVFIVGTTQLKFLALLPAGDVVVLEPLGPLLLLLEHRVVILAFFLWCHEIVCFS